VTTGALVRTFLVPRGAEAAAVRRALAGAPSDATPRLIALPAGRAAVAALPADIEEPVVVTGLCGALRGYSVGDVVVYRRICGAGGSIELDPAGAAALATLLPDASVVDACSTDHVVTTVRERRDLAARYAADVVDMEGAQLAAALVARGRSFAMLRVVSDAAWRELPPLERAIDARGRLDPVQVAFAFVRRPGAAFAFVRDVRSALATLTAAVSAVARTGT
jgi:hypothetical protein